MIDAKELRVGNIVTVNNDKYHPKLSGIPLEVTGISEADDSFDFGAYSIGLKHINQEPNRYYETYSQYIKFIHPIELTPEILEKAGFTKNDDNIFDITDYSLGEVIINDDFTISGQKMPQMDYVHQLQNLYYALTGTELSIQL